MPQVVSPWPLITRMDILEAAKADPPRTWDEFVEVCKKLQNRHGSPAMVCAWHQNDTDTNAMNMIWCYGASRGR